MQSEWYLWQVVFPLGLGTLLIRCSFLFLGDRVRLSPIVKEVFTFIPAAVLPALAIPMVFFHEGIVAAINGKERFVAFLIGVVVCLISKNILVTIVCGLVMLYLLQTYG